MKNFRAHTINSTPPTLGMAAGSGDSPSLAKRTKKCDDCCCIGGGAGRAAVVRHQVMQGKRGNAVPCVFELHPRYEGPMKAIGRGAYGVVCSAHDTASGGQKVAIKKIANAFDNALDARRTLREIRLLRLLRHDNIIRVRDVLRPPNRTSFNDVYIVYDIMDTDLHHIIRSPQPLTDDHCQYFIYQLLRGLKYIHSANVLHRDLKPSNLLLNANCDLKICDFGLARVVDGGVAAGKSASKEERKSGQATASGGSPEPCGALMTEYVVTRWYRAPELLLSCDEYSSAIDVWSVGCIFAELLGRKPIFPGKDYLHQLKLILGTLGSEHVLGSLDDADGGGILRSVSQKARAFLEAQPRTPRACLAQLYPRANPLALNLLDRMLIFDPAKRITVSDALQHPYLSALHDPALEPTAPASLHRLLLLLDQDDRPQCLKDEDAIREKVWQEMLHYHPRDHQDCGSMGFLRHKSAAASRNLDVHDTIEGDDSVSVSSSCRDEDDDEEDDEHDLYNDDLDDEDEEDIDNYGEHDEQQLLPRDPGDAVTVSAAAAAGASPPAQVPSSIPPSPSSAHCLARSSAAPPTPS